MSTLNLQAISTAPSPIDWDKAAKSKACSSFRVRSIAAKSFATLAILFSGAACYLSLKPLQTAVVLANIQTLLTFSCLFLLAAAVMKLWPNSVSDPAYQASLLEKIKTEVNQGASYTDLARRYPLRELLSKDEINTIFADRMSNYTGYQNFIDKEGEEAFNLLDDVRKGALIAKDAQTDNCNLLTTPTAIVSYFLAKEWGYSTIQASGNELLERLSEEDQKQLKSFILKRDCASLTSKSLTPQAFLKKNAIDILGELNPENEQVLIQAFKALKAEEMAAMKELGKKLFKGKFNQAVKTYEQELEVQQQIEALEKSYKTQEKQLKAQADLEQFAKKRDTIAAHIEETQKKLKELPNLDSTKTKEINQKTKKYKSRIEELNENNKNNENAFKKAHALLNKRLLSIHEIIKKEITSLRQKLSGEPSEKFVNAVRAF